MSRNDLAEELNARQRQKLAMDAVTGPTRMQIQNYFDKQLGSQRERIAQTEKAFKLSGIIVNSSGQIVNWSGASDTDCMDFKPFAKDALKSAYQQGLEDGKAGITFPNPPSQGIEEIKDYHAGWRDGSALRRGNTFQARAHGPRE